MKSNHYTSVLAAFSRHLTLSLVAVSALGLFSAAGAPKAFAAEFTDAQKAELQDMFKDYIMKNPEVLMDSVDQYRKRDAQRSMDESKAKIQKYKSYFASNSRAVAGNPNGDVTVVEFFDYNCGYCKRAFPDLMGLLDKDKNVRVVFMEMPILGPQSEQTAKASLAALKQDKYFEFHKIAIAHNGPKNDDTLRGLAEKAGLDVDQFEKDMNSQEISEEVKSSLNIGREIGVRGTPAFIVGDEFYGGYIGAEGLKDAIAKARGQKDDKKPAAQ